MNPIFQIRNSAEHDFVHLFSILHPYIFFVKLSTQIIYLFENSTSSEKISILIKCISILYRVLFHTYDVFISHKVTRFLRAYEFI